MDLLCPHCSGAITVEAKVQVKTRKVKRRVSPGQQRALRVGGQIDQAVLRPVKAFVRQLTPGRYQFSELADLYEDWRVGCGGPPIRRPDLSSAIELAGGTRWRTADARGFDIPENLEQPHNPVECTDVACQTCWNLTSDSNAFEPPQANESDLAAAQVEGEALGYGLPPAPVPLPVPMTAPPPIVPTHWKCSLHGKLLRADTDELRQHEIDEHDGASITVMPVWEE